MVQDNTTNYMGSDIIKDSIKEDHQTFIREVIFHRAKVGDSIQGITSTKGVHLIDLLAKSPAYGRKPLC